MKRFITKIISMTYKPKQLFCLTQPIDAQNHPPSKFQMKYFSDRIRLTLHAGKGGSGSIAYFTSKNVRKGNPDGGQGGQGGQIVLQAHSSLHDLSHLRRRVLHGVNGKNGGPRGKDGKNGGKTIIRVPCGTTVYQIKKEQQNQTKDFVADLEANLQQITIVKGGQAGKGNKKHPFMSQYVDNSKIQKLGKQGQSKIIFLQLKTLADVGLVGLPNIGKSTFLAAVSRALPKIANYQFTTLKPSIGLVKFVDDFAMSIADIPGIIQDAHKNKGLGFQFLRHIQRTKVLVFMLDITKQDPLKQYKLLQNQLYEYNKEKFSKKKRVIIINKGDRVNDMSYVQSIQKQIKQPSFLISAREGHNVGNAIIQLRSIIQKLREQQKIEREARLFDEERKGRVQF